jgi:7 transmembrane receptor (rhodopsin family)
MLRCILFILVVLQISLASIVGNGLVVATIARHRDMRTQTNLLLTNLAAVDILASTIDMPFSIFSLIKGSWVLGESACKFNAFTTGLAFVASIHTLMVIRLGQHIFSLISLITN